MYNYMITLISYILMYIYFTVILSIKNIQKAFDYLSTFITAILVSKSKKYTTVKINVQISAVFYLSSNP